MDFEKPVSPPPGKSLERKFNLKGGSQERGPPASFQVEQLTVWLVGYLESSLPLHTYMVFF